MGTTEKLKLCIVLIAIFNVDHVSIIQAHHVFHVLIILIIIKINA